MDKNVLGNICFTTLFAAMLFTGLVENEKPSVNVLPDTFPINHGTANDRLASSTIFPVTVPNTLPLPDMSDVAAEAVLGEAFRQENAGVAPESEDSDDSVKAPDSINPMMGSFLAEKPFTLHPGSMGFLSRVSALTSLFTREFNPLFIHSGYHRPAWQDINEDTELDNLADDSKPFLVVIDPGHGGSDPGARAHNGLLEKELTLDIARRVRLFLTEIDEIEVQLTRTHDYGLSRNERVSTIRDSEADLVISLHFNHLPQAHVNLVETFYAGPENIHESLASQRELSPAAFHRTSLGWFGANPDLSFTEGSARLARDLQQRIFSEVSFENEHVQNAGVKTDTLFVLTQTYTPGVLLEISCLSYADEADRLMSLTYRNRLSAALVDGIRNYYDSLKSKPLIVAGNLGV